MQLVRNVVSVDFHVTKYKTIVIELTKEVSERERVREGTTYTPRIVLN